ncbi:MAG: enoyl-CoA hydratase [Deltaproteobacteria bacterium]|nr:MAG: enoyl-CoA hydratase [Deltaproteobacteria bacterium]
MDTPTPAEDILLHERLEGTALLTLHRPERRNALSRQLVLDLQHALDALGPDPDVRAIILTGAGDRAFCAGADLRERESMSDAEVNEFLDQLRTLMDTLAQLPKPTIAAINGFALGGGLELALACDLRIAADNATLGLTEVRLGIIPGAGGTQRLTRLLGPGKAKELILTARRLPARQALDIGLVNDVCTPDDLRHHAIDLADEIAQAAPLAVAQAKHAIDEGSQRPLHEGLDIERQAYAPLLHTRDRVEALEAFRERRAPRFEGR